MNKFEDKQKKRIKNALKIMRKSAGIKYEVVKDVHGMDPSHVENGDSFPTMATIVNYSLMCRSCPGWLLLLSSQVDNGTITEPEFYDIISNWDFYKQLAEMKVGELMNMIKAGIRC